MGEVFDSMAIMGTGFYLAVISQQALTDHQITCKPVSESHTTMFQCIRMGQIMWEEGRHQVKIQDIWLRGKLPYT